MERLSERSHLQEGKKAFLSPILTNYPSKRFQLSIEAPNGDVDPSNDEDSC